MTRTTNAIICSVIFAGLRRILTIWSEFESLHDPTRPSPQIEFLGSLFKSLGCDANIKTQSTPDRLKSQFVDDYDPWRMWLERKIAHGRLEVLVGGISERDFLGKAILIKGSPPKWRSPLIVIIVLSRCHLLPSRDARQRMELIWPGKTSLPFPYFFMRVKSSTIG